MARPDQQLVTEAAVFSRYLIKKLPNQTATQVYVKAMKAHRQSLETKDQKLLAFVIAHPWSLGFIDAGLPFYRPYSEVRRRLYIMLAILEANPAYHDNFLPVKRSFWYWLFVGYSGVRAIVKAIIGSIMVRVVGS